MRGGTVLRNVPLGSADALRGACNAATVCYAPRMRFGAWSGVVFGCLLVARQAVGAPNLKLDIRSEDIDVQNRTIYFRLGTVARTAEIDVFSPDGELMYEGSKQYDPHEPGTRLSIDWPYLADRGENFRIELKFIDTEGYWVTFQVIRFYLEVPHEDIAFETAKWDITEKEEPKLVEPLKLLKDAVAKYAKLMDVKLYVAGHTDTVGKAAANQLLSEQRANSIARYFIQHGLKGIPIFVRGFGEGALAVKTKDNVANASNRRAQYIISTFTPEVAGPGSWQQVR